MSKEEAEPEAMLSIARALANLSDDAARRRVIAWAADRYGVGNALAPSASTGPIAESSVYDTIADLFDAARPSNDREKAIVAAYWKTKVEGNATFVSQELNKLLTDLGHKCANITDALSSSMNDKPALILQLKKSGSSKQARKTYKMSDAGIKWLERRLRGEQDNE